MAQTNYGAAKVVAAKTGMTVEEFLHKVGAGEKWCYKCLKWQNTIAFSRDISRFDGLNSTCRACRARPYRKRPGGKKGRKFSAKACENIRQSKVGTKSKFKGVPRTTKDRIAISEAIRKVAKSGPDAYWYKDGLSRERVQIRRTKEYVRWRFDVFSRDGFKCQDCGDGRGRNLEAHHLKSFADYPELRFEVSNGKTLCRPCHKEVHRKMQVSSSAIRASAAERRGHLDDGIACSPRTSGAARPEGLVPSASA